MARVVLKQGMGDGKFNFKTIFHDSGKFNGGESNRRRNSKQLLASHFGDTTTTSATDIECLPCFALLRPFSLSSPAAHFEDTRGKVPQSSLFGVHFPLQYYIRLSAQTTLSPPYCHHPPIHSLHPFPFFVNSESLFGSLADSILSTPHQSVSQPGIPPPQNRQNPLDAHSPVIIIRYERTPQRFLILFPLVLRPFSDLTGLAAKLSVPAIIAIIIILIFICCTPNSPPSVRCVITIRRSSNNNKTATRMQRAPQRRNNEMKTLLFWDNCAKITTKNDPAMFYLHRGMKTE